MYQSFLRADKLLILRGLACIAVVIQHAGPPRNFITLLGYDFSWLAWVDAGVAVQIFFILSGYLMGKAFFTKRYSFDLAGIKKFYIARARRILPLYYFAAITLALFYQSDFINYRNWKAILKVVTFTYDHTPLNIAFWTLAVEVQFYLLVPFIYFLFRGTLHTKWKSVLSLVLVVAFAFIQRYYGELWNQLPRFVEHSILLHGIDLFLAGFLVFPLLTHLKQYRIPYSKIAWLLVPISLLYYTYSSYIHYKAGGGLAIFTSQYNLQGFATIIFGVFALILIEGYALSPTGVQSRFTTTKDIITRSFEYLGTLSYGIYVWHFPILSAVGTQYPAMEGEVYPYFRKVFITLILSGIFAFITYQGVEKYFMKKKPSLATSLGQS
jgi:peptidoglycan/LPS O-acetylase OafA/YrhL